MAGLRTQVTAVAIQIWDGYRGRVKEPCSIHRVVGSCSVRSTRRCFTEHLHFMFALYGALLAVEALV